MEYGLRKIITVICVTYVQKDFWIRTLINGWQLAKMKKSIPDMSLP